MTTTYDIQFTQDGIELDAPINDNGDSKTMMVLPHIPASQAMADGEFGMPGQEDAIRDYLREHGLSLHGLYARDTTATTLD